MNKMSSYYDGDGSSLSYAIYKGEELTVTFSGSPSICDYGVPRSPVWTEVDNVEVDEVTLFDIPIRFSVLPEDLQKTLLALADECEWQN